jgi:hypothetical protein
VVAVPVFVARRFDAGLWESVTGLLWACMGAAYTLVPESDHGTVP